MQSERSAAYADALGRLAGQTYECFCTRREIAEAASAPHGEPGRYPGTCRDLTEAERAERLRSGRSPALRIRADGAVMTITDLQHGQVTGRVEDVVVRRPVIRQYGDGAAAYQLAVVVDDGASGVDQVVRGDDLLASAPTQAWLATRLGLPVPTYAHVPLALNVDGRRLAKRDGAVTAGRSGSPRLDARPGAGPAGHLTGAGRARRTGRSRLTCWPASTRRDSRGSPGSCDPTELFPAE